MRIPERSYLVDLTPLAVGPQPRPRRRLRSAVFGLALGALLAFEVATARPGRVSRWVDEQLYRWAYSLPMPAATPLDRARWDAFKVVYSGRIVVQAWARGQRVDTRLCWFWSADPGGCPRNGEQPW